MRRFAALPAFTAALAGCASTPPAPHFAATPPAYTARESFAALAPSSRACLADLGARRAAYTPIPDQYFGAGCSQIASVRLLSLAGDSADLGVTNLGPVTCRLANTFAGWARFGVDRAARLYLGSALVRIETMGSYNCRNIAGSDRRSAHATGNAIDVAGFVLADGRRISVLRDWNSLDAPTREFLTVIHASACRRFGTVLGPDYNPAHHNHFHLEVNEARAFCR